MQVAVLVNERSGRGRAQALASAVHAAVEARGGSVRRPGLDCSDGDFREALLGCAAAVVVGGDGTVRSVAARLAGCGSGVPLAIAPVGTENLAAREFGFRADPPALVGAIARGRVRRVDLGMARSTAGAGHAFLVMLSAGLDADVVHDLDSRRRGPIRHWAYLPPILRAAVRWRPPAVRAVDAAGGRGPSGRGQVVVANARQYALRLDPVRRADPGDGALDLAVLEAGGCWSLVGWAMRLALVRGIDGGPAATRSTRWTLRFDRPVLLQADGDPVPFGLVDAVEVAVLPGAVAVVDTRA